MKLVFVEKKQETGSIWSFFFRPVEPLGWVAGQSIRLELPRTSWGIDERRFTISSSPHEKLVRITTKMSDSGFKQTLSSLKKGIEINGFNVEGTFVWDSKPHNRILIAGGIGITPYRSMLAERINIARPINSYLIYCYKTDVPVFGEEIRAWQAIDPTLKLDFYTHRFAVSTISDWELWRESLIYISGPTAMVKEIAELLVANGIHRSQLRIDLFSGATE